jgi:hypothetical protein
MPRGRVANFMLEQSALERADLERITRSPSLPVAMVWRAEIILLSADGATQGAIRRGTRRQPAAGGPLAAPPSAGAPRGLV